MNNNLYLSPKDKIDAYLYMIIGILLIFCIIGIIPFLFGLIKLTKKTTYTFVDKGVRTDEKFLYVFDKTKIDRFNNIGEYDIKTSNSVISKLFKNEYTTIIVNYEILRGSNFNALSRREIYHYYVSSNSVDKFLDDIDNLYKRVKKENKE